mmetsp:Transcript_27036/g.62844  ORF Transcript_27036/g.62844 Transcript_27036/m.62844 type:complete len:308 (-) Transcript_27036:93-1016(-)
MMEKFLWDKYDQIDFFRKRYPLENLVNQARWIMEGEIEQDQPRDWIGPVVERSGRNTFVLIPECKRFEPSTGMMVRKRYDLEKVPQDFVEAEVPAMSVNCDSILFRGAMDDVHTVRTSTKAAASNLNVNAPPILVSDLIVYPFQLFKMFLSGADAITLMAGALEPKDLSNLSKVAAKINLQVLVSATSEAQIDDVIKALSQPELLTGLIVSNRDLADFSFDETGEQVLRLLKSDAMERFRQHFGSDKPVLVEGRVGIIEHENDKGDEKSVWNYIDKLKDAGAIGAIVGGGLAMRSKEETIRFLQGKQ